METYKKYKQKIDIFFDKNRISIGIILFLFIVFSGTFLMVQGANAQRDASTIKSTDFVQTSNEATSQDNSKKALVAPEEIVFDIEGAVATPGVYRLPVGSVMVDAINKAGGFNIEADSERIAKEINQASLIGNNSKIYIFKNSDKDAILVAVSSSQNYTNSSSAGSSGDSLQSTSSTKINLNKASSADLDTLPGIGPALAQRIIDWRDANGGFEVIEDIKKVKGIGDSVFEGMKNQITIE